MKNSINNQFKMRRHGGQADRATETSPSSYSVNQERTMANMGMAPTNYGTPLNNDPGDKKTTGEPKKDDFRYESDASGVTGTAYTKSGTEKVTEYKPGGKTMQKGDTYERGGFQTPKTVVDTGRDASGRKKAGETGQVTVAVKKGDIRFS